MTCHLLQVFGCLGSRTWKACWRESGATRVLVKATIATPLRQTMQRSMCRSRTLPPALADSAQPAHLQSLPRRFQQRHTAGRDLLVLLLRTSDEVVNRQRAVWLRRPASQIREVVPGSLGSRGKGLVWHGWCEFDLYVIVVKSCLTVLG